MTKPIILIKMKKNKNIEIVLIYNKSKHLITRYCLIHAQGISNF